MTDTAAQLLELIALDDRLKRNGILNFTAREICSMRKANNALAIPPASMWNNIIPTLILAEKLSSRMGEYLGLERLPLFVGNGYRPKDYNKAVGGEPGSTHIMFRALDLDLLSKYSNAHTQEIFYREACKLFLEAPKDLYMGLGLYRPHRGTRIHIDTGYANRWKRPGYWKKKWVKPILEELK
jgi:hypothetical protein